MASKPKAPSSDDLAAKAGGLRKTSGAGGDAVLDRAKVMSEIGKKPALKKVEAASTGVSDEMKKAAAEDMKAKAKTKVGLDASIKAAAAAAADGKKGLKAVDKPAEGVSDAVKEAAKADLQEKAKVAAGKKDMLAAIKKA